MKIVTIIGARPQFIKAATVSRAAKSFALIEEVIVHTGQHFDHAMSDVFFEEMEIPKPTYNLQVSGLNHGAMTGRMLEKIEDVLLSEKPDCVLVYGDTNSTLAGALAAVKLHIPVAHVEAGLRSFNMQMPEEVNRILTDRVSSLLFAPTQTAVDNLKKEGITSGVRRTGDLMADAFYFYKSQAEKKATVFKTIPYEKFGLATIHRAENTDNLETLREICEALNELNKTLPIILPLHPRTKSRIESSGIKLEVHSVPPVGYFDMLQLLSHCSLVLTDSGGLQKEAYLSKKPCVTLRNETEWVELVQAKVNLLAGANKQIILNSAKTLMSSSNLNFEEMLYGSGHSADEILSAIKSFKHGK